MKMIKDTSFYILIYVDHSKIHHSVILDIFFIIINDFSYRIWIFFFKNKSNALAKFKEIHQSINSGNKKIQS